MSDNPAQTPKPLAIALALRDALEALPLGACHWKSNGHLADALVGATDIDLYVPQATAPHFDVILKQLGALKIVSQPWARYPGIEDWLLFDQDTGGLLHLHLHHALLTGLKRVKHLQIPWDAKLVGSIRKADGSNFPIPSAEMEYLVLLVRIWAKMPPWRRVAGWRVPSSIVRELEWLRTQCKPANVAQLLAELLPGFPQEHVLRLLDSPTTPNTAVEAGQLLNRALTNSHRMSWTAALFMAARRNATMVLHRVARAILPMAQVGKTLMPRGVVIAVIGSDGAGKSTVTDALTKWLRFKIDTHCLYLGTGDSGSGVFDMVRRGVRTILRSGKRSSSSKPENTMPKGGTLAKFIALHHLVLARHKLRQMQLARNLATAGRVVILDRLPQMQHLGINDGMRLQSGDSFGWAARLERAFFEQMASLPPDLVIRLDISPDAALARKPDHDYDTLARKSGIVASLTFPGTQLIAIDASQPVETVMRIAKQAVWAKLKEQQA